MARRPRALLLPAVALMIAAGAAPAVAARDTARTDQIAFARIDWGAGASSIGVAGPDGTGRRRIVGGRGDATSPAWSPTGQRIAYGWRTDAWRLTVADADGRHAHAVTPVLGLADAPSWAPDGRAIAFVRLTARPPAVGVRAQQVWIVRSGGGGMRPVTTDARFPHGAGRPSWSPDDRTIAFHAWSGPPETTAPAVWVVRTDGTGARRLLPRASDPAWSPDGTAIAFSRGGEIYTADAAGRHVHRVTRTRDRDDAPAWSPDGTRLAFATTRRARDPAADDQWVTVARLDGTVTGRVTDPDPDSWFGSPAWRPGV